MVTAKTSEKQLSDSTDQVPDSSEVVMKYLKYNELSVFELIIFTFNSLNWNQDSSYHILTL